MSKMRKIYAMAWIAASSAVALFFIPNVYVSLFSLLFFIVAFTFLFTIDLLWKSRSREEIISSDRPTFWKRLGRVAFNVFRLVLLGYSVLPAFHFIRRANVGAREEEAGIVAGVGLLIVLCLGMFDRIGLERRAETQYRAWIKNRAIMLEVLEEAAKRSQGQFSAFEKVRTLMKNGHFKRAKKVSKRSDDLGYLNGIVKALGDLGTSANESRKHLKEVKKGLNTTILYLKASIAGLNSEFLDDRDKDLTNEVVRDMERWQHEDWRLRLQVARNYILCNDLDAARQQIGKIRGELESGKASELLSEDVLLRKFLGDDCIDDVLKMLQAANTRS